MKTKINIAEIIKDKPKGTKLYSPIFGNLRYEDLVPDLGEFTVVTSDNTSAKHSFWSDGRYNRHGEPLMLLPSKEMPDWSKFAWKKGDVLVSNDSDAHIIFKGFSKSDYTAFEGKHWISVSKKRYLHCLKMQNTQDYHIEDDKDVAQTYINNIEKRLGGKLNMNTLEIEPVQPEFKDGDIVYAESNAYHYPSIHILNINGDTKRYYARLVINGSYNEAIDYDISAFDDDDPNRLRLATEAEKKQLFYALAKEGKAWDADKKEVVALKSLWTPKPFDRVITRNAADDIWTANIFSHMDSHGEYVTIACVGGYTQCLPYNEETAKLIGTTDNWEG